jgi:hypothetical protein
MSAPGADSQQPGRTLPHQHLPGPRPGSTSFVVLPTPDQIADRARALWVAQGCPLGTSVEFWYRAEAELIREINSS